MSSFANALAAGDSYLCKLCKGNTLHSLLCWRSRLCGLVVVVVFVPKLSHLLSPLSAFSERSKRAKCSKRTEASQSAGDSPEDSLASILVAASSRASNERAASEQQARQVQQVRTEAPAGRPLVISVGRRTRTWPQLDKEAHFSSDA